MRDEEHDFGQAVNFYKALSANYTNFYYGVEARKRLTVLGRQSEAAPSPTLSSIRKVTVPDLASVVPENDPHYIKAKLLANAALNEYIGPEIQASPTAGGVGSSGTGADLLKLRGVHPRSAVHEAFGYILLLHSRRAKCLCSTGG